MKLLKLKYLFLTIMLLIGLGSCVEREDVTEMDYLLKKISDGKATEKDLNKLIESLEVEGETLVYPPEGKFKLTFPVSNVKNKVVKQIIDGKVVEYYQYNANCQGKNHPNLAYQIMYAFVSDVKSEKDINLFFDGQRDYIVSGTNAAIEFEMLDETKGVTGRHLYLTIDDSNLKTNTKMFIRNGIYYQLSVVTEEGHLFNNQITEFFDSFEILD